MARLAFTPRHWRLSLLTIAGVITAGCLAGSYAAAAKEKEDKSLAAFMRKKLEASSLILEGITIEDADLVAKGATALLEMSKAEKWQVIADDEYRDFNRDFRSAVHKLNEAAEAKNFDNATLQWFDAIKGCVECHKYVRSNRPVTK